MEINFSLKEDTLTVRLAGEIDHHVCDEIRTEIDRELTRCGAVSLNFDFSSVTFMDSSGIGMVLGRYKKVTAQGGRVKIRNAGSLVRQLLDMAGIFSLMEYEEDGEETDGK